MSSKFQSIREAEMLLNKIESYLASEFGFGVSAQGNLRKTIESNFNEIQVLKKIILGDGSMDKPGIVTNIDRLVRSTEELKKSADKIKNMQITIICGIIIFIAQQILSRAVFS